ncbi:hypothetical protein FA95DRAFT_1190916 [Auriscalpium vulgare]|uniref:Uncharacterized protein n=1 Tax=Auriscalpium vulgare TaxID=40419 RepID=A0ACB8RUD1_9AGAM|nr:hypothetical protein FA95DRAFT_1190916 [Auriscalpium vulgare]
MPATAHDPPAKPPLPRDTSPPTDAGPAYEQLPSTQRMRLCKIQLVRAIDKRIATRVPSPPGPSHQPMAAAGGCMLRFPPPRCPSRCGRLCCPNKDVLILTSRHVIGMTVASTRPVYLRTKVFALCVYQIFCPVALYEPLNRNPRELRVPAQAG